MEIAKSNEPDAFSQFEREGWTGKVDGYVRHFGPVTAQSVEATLDAAHIAAGKRMLDVCAGHGVLSVAAAARGAKTVALDFSESMVEAVRRNAPHVEARQGDAQHLPFDDDAFDAVVCGYGVLHVPEPERALSEMRRVLKPGGRVAVTVWESPTPDNGFGVVWAAVKTHGRLDVGLPHGPDAYQFGSANAMAAALAHVGFIGTSASRVAQSWPQETADGVVDSLIEGSVRMKALLLAQAPEAAAAIRAAVRREVERKFRFADGYRVAMPAVVGSGAKPAA